MSAAIPFSARFGSPEKEPPDGVLLRLPLDARRGMPIPSAPAGADITVSLSPAAAAGSAQDLEALGYRCVGRSPVSGTAGPTADFLVSEAVLERHPRWCQELAGHAEQVFRLAFGPALAALADVLDAHRT